MHIKKSEILVQCFRFLCVLAAVFMSAFWFHTYRLNHDLCLVDYKPFYEREDDLVPTQSFCLKNPFLQDRLIQEYGVSESSYLSFLEGNYFSQQMLDIVYENVTLDISNYITEYYVLWTNETEVTYKHPHKLNPTVTSISFNGFWRNSFYRCYALQVPKHKDISFFSILLMNQVFRNNTRPIHNDFFTLIHYPNHLVTSILTKRNKWKKLTSQSTYDMRFEIGSIEILRRRNKNGNPCNENWANYDDWMIGRHEKAVGCKAPYHNHLKSSLPMCATQEKMHRARFVLSPDVMNKYIPPCKSMQTVHYKYRETDLSGTKWAGNGKFWFSLVLETEGFKEIQQSRYYLYIFF